jgi:hypothetical protein
MVNMSDSSNKEDELEIDSDEIFNLKKDIQVLIHQLSLNIQIHQDIGQYTEFETVQRKMLQETPMKEAYWRNDEQKA